MKNFVCYQWFEHKMQKEYKQNKDQINSCFPESVFRPIFQPVVKTKIMTSWLNIKETNSIKWIK